MWCLELVLEVVAVIQELTCEGLFLRSAGNPPRVSWRTSHVLVYYFKLLMGVRSRNSILRVGSVCPRRLAIVGGNTSDSHLALILPETRLGLWPDLRSDDVAVGLPMSGLAHMRGRDEVSLEAFLMLRFRLIDLQICCYRSFALCRFGLGFVHLLLTIRAIIVLRIGWHRYMRIIDRWVGLTVLLFNLPNFEIVAAWVLASWVDRLSLLLWRGHRHDNLLISELVGIDWRLRLLKLLLQVLLRGHRIGV